MKRFLADVELHFESQIKKRMKNIYKKMSGFLSITRPSAKLEGDNIIFRNKSASFNSQFEQQHMV